MDRIEIKGLRVFAHHGALAEERRRGQTFVVDLSLELDLAAAADSDALGDTVHYGELAEQVAAEIRTTRFSLIEALASHVAGVVLRDARVHAATVRVAKPAAPVDAVLDEVAVVLRRDRPRAEVPHT